MGVVGGSLLYLIVSVLAKEVVGSLFFHSLVLESRGCVDILSTEFTWARIEKVWEYCRGLRVLLRRGHWFFLRAWGGGIDLEEFRTHECL